MHLLDLGRYSALFVTRILKGTVAVLTPDGRVEREINMQAKEPTNLAFGGPDGTTVYVTQRKGGFIESFRVERPGREHCLQRLKAANTSCRLP
jgi:signal peptidase